MEDNKNNILKAYNFINSIENLSELYYYWMLTGGKIHATLKGHTDSKSIIDNYHHNSFKQESIKEKETLIGANSQCLLPSVLRIPHYLALVQSNATRAIASKEQWPLGEIPQPRT